MTEMSTNDVLNALDEVWSSLYEVTSDLSEAQWATITDCPGWDVKDQLSHLIGIELSLEGEAPPEVELPQLAHVKNPIGEMNERWVQARRPRTGEGVRQEFKEVTDRRLAELRAAPEERFDEIGWSPVGQVPYRVFMAVRVLDSWLHEQDARLALGRPGGLGGRGEAISIARADLALGFAVGKGAGAPDGSSVAFEIVGPLGGRRRIEVVGGRATRLDGDDATATITMSQQTYMRRFGGRISALDALDSPGTIISGDPELAAKVLESLSVMI